MISNKILIVASYPISQPQHGGQKRTRALVDFYKKIFTDVRFVAVTHAGFYEPDDQTILPGRETTVKKVEVVPHAGDIIMGKAIFDDAHIKNVMKNIIEDFKPDIIQVEQIFPYLGLEALLNELNVTPKLIYSSQNIESKMKQEIYIDLNIAKSQRQSLVNEVVKAEATFSKSADLVITVSEDDAKAHKTMGAKRCIVIPNGIEKTRASKKALSYWADFKKLNYIKQMVCFVGSGHSPNWAGFLEMISHDTSFMPRDAKIIVAGGVAEYFKSKFPKNSNFWEGCIAVGKLEEDNLAGVLASSEGVLLPITKGGGSNLKTAEAILSGKKIVGTSFAFRSFDKYLELPNIYVADTQKEFQQKILEALNTPPIRLNHKDRKLTEHVQWKYCLQPLKSEVKKLVSSSYQDSVRAYAKVTYKEGRKNLGNIRRAIKR